MLFLFPLNGVTIYFSFGGSDLASLPASSLWTCMSLIRVNGLMHLQVFWVVLTLLSYSGRFFIVSVPVFVFCDFGRWLELLLVMSRAKKWLSASAFSISQVTRSLFSFWRGPTFSLVFLFSWHIQRNFSCCAWHHWPDYSLRALAFLAWSVAVHTLLLPSSLSLLQSSIGFFLSEFGFVQKLLFIFAGLLANLPNFLSVGMHLFWTWKMWSWILKSFLGPFFFSGLYPTIKRLKIPEEAKVCFPEVLRAVSFLSTLLAALRILNFSMEPRLSLSFILPTSLSLLVRTRSTSPSLLAPLALAEWSCDQCIPGTLLCYPSNRYWDDWSPLWGPGFVNVRTLLSVHQGHLICSVLQVAPTIMTPFPALLLILIHKLSVSSLSIPRWWSSVLITDMEGDIPSFLLCLSFPKTLYLSIPTLQSQKPSYHVLWCLPGNCSSKASSPAWQTCVQGYASFSLIDKPQQCPSRPGFSKSAPWSK